MSAPITRTHRLAVARAWEGDGRARPTWVHRWIETGAGAHDAEEATLERLAQLVADAEGKQAAELLKHQDLVEALQWLPVGTVVNFCDLDDFLEELRGKPVMPGGPGRWLPIRECKHRRKGDNARCVQCRNEDDE
jgi:hypothetical protein